MTQKAVALLAKASQADVCHYVAGRFSKIGNAALARIAAVYEKGGASQTKVVEYHLETRGTLTQLYASVEYGILRLSERVRELNSRYERQGINRRIRNLHKAGEIGGYAEYKLEESK